MTLQSVVLDSHPPTVPMLLDGKLIESGTDEWHDVINPATQEVLARVPLPLTPRSPIVSTEL